MHFVEMQFISNCYIVVSHYAMYRHSIYIMHPYIFPIQGLHYFARYGDSVPCLLTHIHTEDLPIRFNWTRPFPNLVVSDVLFIFILFQIEIPISKTVPTQIRRRRMSYRGLHCLPGRKANMG